MKKAIVYFVQSASGLIKIGWTADIERRLVNLQSATHEQLVVKATIEANQAFEEHLHEMFAASRVRGEWFQPTPEILALVDAASNGRFIVPHGFHATQSELVGFNASKAALEAVEEARQLIVTIAGKPKAGRSDIASMLFQVSQTTRIPVRRIRGFWNREARVISSVEMDRLRACASKDADFPQMVLDDITSRLKECERLIQGRTMVGRGADR